MSRAQRQLTPLGGTLFALAIINFAAFMIGAGLLGGDALNGRIAGGRYYVADHGRLTEVSSRAWHYSRWHAISIWITHPLGIAGAAFFSRPKPFVVDPRRRAADRPTAWETLRLRRRRPTSRDGDVPDADR